MLPLPLPAVSTGALHGVLKLVGSEHRRGLRSAVAVTLRRPL